MTEVLEEAHGRRVILVPDQDPENPRVAGEHLCHAVTVPDRQYRDVDAHGGPLSHGWSYYLRRHDSGHAPDLFARWARIYHGAAILHDTPAGGPVSLWYLLPQQFGEVGDPDAALACERDEYRAWAEGDVYGYVIQERATWTREASMPPQQRITWEDTDSVWGLYGYEYAAEQARAAFTGEVTVSLSATPHS